MSITNDAPEQPADSPPPAKASLLQEIGDFICSLAFPYDQILTAHAVNSPHEDVPEDVQSPNAAVLSPSSYWAQGFDNCPARLRSLVPPANFGAVVSGAIYRSSYPAEENYPFLKSLGLKTIITLVPEELSFHYLCFMAENSIEHFQIHVPANKGEMTVSPITMAKVLRIVMERANHPILIHCNKGKHRTGCVVGCLRKVQGEELGSICEEYHTYADPKARILDECFIEQFDVQLVSQTARENGWAPPVIEPPPPSPESPIMTLSVARPRA